MDIISLHLVSLGFVLSFVILSDLEGHLWMRGKEINFRQIKLFHKLVLLGLSLMIITGFTMFWPLRDYLLQDTAFKVKMIFVLALVINSQVVGKLIEVANRPYKSLTKKEKRPLLISGVVSILGWVGAVTSALLIGI